MHRREPQAVGLLARRAGQREAPGAAGAQLQQAGLRRVDLVDARERAGGLEADRLRRIADLAAGAQADHAEAAAAAQAAADEVEVARLEDLELQPRAGKQHQPQRKQRQFGGGCAHWGTLGPAARSRRAGMSPFGRPGGAQAPTPSSRWRTSAGRWLPKRRASISTKYTERCWPPVQPMATVR